MRPKLRVRVDVEHYRRHVHPGKRQKASQWPRNHDQGPSVKLQKPIPKLIDCKTRASMCGSRRAFQHRTHPHCATQKSIDLSIDLYCHRCPRISIISRITGVVADIRSNNIIAVTTNDCRAHGGRWGCSRCSKHRAARSRLLATESCVVSSNLWRRQRRVGQGRANQTTSSNLSIRGSV
jgi:hypothetical protein